MYCLSETMNLRFSNCFLANRSNLNVNFYCSIYITCIYIYSSKKAAEKAFLKVFAVQKSLKKVCVYLVWTSWICWFWISWNGLKMLRIGGDMIIWSLWLKNCVGWGWVVEWGLQLGAEECLWCCWVGPRAWRCRVAEFVVVWLVTSADEGASARWRVVDSGAD